MSKLEIGIEKMAPGVP